jgi:Ca2+/H+ antiporter
LLWLLPGGMRYRTQELNRATARFQSGPLLQVIFATIAMTLYLMPPATAG